MNYTYKASDKPNSRIDVADILRGIAIAGIILIHFQEQMNFFMFPEPKSDFWAAVNSGVWDTIFFLLAGKMYAIFSILFGLSFFIQHDNQAQKGIDFRPRFLWRMILLMLFGIFDLLFYNGDILFIYAVCGILIIPLIRASDKVIWIFIALMLIQPVELVYLIKGIINPDTMPLNLGSGKYYGAMLSAQSSGSILDVAKVGLKYGLPANFLWAVENGRMTQNVLFFLIGIMLGRTRLFYNEGNNLKIWKKVLVGSVIAFAVLLPMYKYIPGLCESRCVSNSFSVAFNMWKNLAMMFFIVAGVTEELAHQDRTIRKDESHQLPDSVHLRSDAVLQLGIRPFPSFRTHCRLLPRDRIHRPPVHVLHMVDEAPQERTFRAVMVHGHMVWKEKITLNI